MKLLGVPLSDRSLASLRSRPLDFGVPWTSVQGCLLQIRELLLMKTGLLFLCLLCVSASSVHRTVYEL